MIVTFYGGVWHVVTRDGRNVVDITEGPFGKLTVTPGPTVTIEFDDGITIDPKEPHA